MNTLKLITVLILVTLITILCITQVYAQDESFIATYGCSALYTTDDPDILADYMVELIGYQPVKTTLTSYVDEVPCNNLDVGRIVFNVCGITGDEHDVCSAWINEYSHFYSDDFYYTFYSSSLLASRNTSSSTQKTLPLQTVEQITDETTNSFSFNIIHVIIVLILLSVLGYVAYNRSMYNSTPNKENDND